MAFLVDESTRIVIQGITGRLGRKGLEMMRAAGSAVVAGVTPGRGGDNVEGVRVFDTVEEARVEAGANASILFVPGLRLRDAALEAIAARMDPIVLMVDGVPINSALDIVAAATQAGVRVIGPNSPGVISPGLSLLGALDARFYRRGNVAVVSRSGGMMTTVAHALTSAGIGQSTCVGIGGDSIIGLDLVQSVQLAEQDDGTSAIVIYGEVGTGQEHRLAAYLAGAPLKPVHAYIAGIQAVADIRYSHAGAKIEAATGTAQSKREALAAAGAQVVSSYPELVNNLHELEFLS
jgi:succinyl-CoA synthetase alpha subunit